jgi:putative ABC transport system permease protein
MTGGRGAASTESDDPPVQVKTVRLMTGYHRSVWWWTSVTCGTLAVAVALAVLMVGTTTPASVRLTGSMPGAGVARSYDIIVSAPGSGGAGSDGSTKPAALDNLSGGITLGQYDAIRKLPGVAVAAPLTMVGYVPFTVSAPMAIPAPVRAAAPTGVTLTVRLRSDNGLSTVTWDDVTVAYPTLKPSTLSVKLSWTFQLPLVAVDPAAEARLLNLNGAVTSGTYLPEAAASGSGPVPMLMAESLASNESAQVTIDSPASATATLTTASAYQQLVGEVTSTPGTISGYWTAGSVTYAPAPGGALTPEPVSANLAAAWNGAYQWAGEPAEASALDVPFRTLTEHAALAGGATVRAVGVFDPAKVASAPATPSPYRPELLTGADERSRQLLGGQPLAPDGDPSDYARSGAALVVPLADIGAFTRGYAGAASTGPANTGPIGAIRVRVAGAAGDTAASEDKISAVAQEIVRATGLRVQPVLGTTVTTRVVALPAGLHGRPPLLVDEVWYHNDVRTTVWTGLGLDSIVLVELQLLAGEVGIGWGTWRLLRSRRRELATLRALGWRRRQLAGRLLAEFAPTAVIAVAAAALAGYAIGAALAGRLEWAWLLLCVPAVIAAVIPWARRTLLAAKGGGRAKRRAPGGDWPRWRGWLAGWRSTRPGRAGAPARLVRRGLRAGSRKLLLRTLVIAGASLAFSLKVAARWAFAGAATSWTQRPVTGQGTLVDGAAVLIVVLMATFTVADLDWVALRERAVEVRTLRAIGWSALDLTRLTVRNAVWPGLYGGLIAGGTDLLVGLPASGAAPLRLIALVVLATASGIALSLLANGLSTYSVIRAEASNN